MAGLPYIFTNVGNPEIDATQVNADFNYVLNNATATAVASGADLSGLGVFNVKHYGAKGDGVTDDTAAIQAAITAVPAVGGVVYLPAGNYMVSATLSVTVAGTFIVGDGSGTILIPKSTFTGSSVVSVTANACAFYRFSISGASSTYSSNPAVDGITILGAASCFIDHFWSFYLNGWAIKIAPNGTFAASNNLLSNIFVGQGKQGICSTSVGSTNGYTGGLLATNVMLNLLQNGDGVFIEQTNDVQFVNLNAYSVAGGAAIHLKGGVAGGGFSNIDIQGPATGSAMLIEQGADAKSPSNLQISGGVIQGSAPNLNITSGNDLDFIGVLFNNAAGYGLSIASGNGNISFTSCRFKGTVSSYDANIQTVAAVEFTGCTFESSGSVFGINCSAGGKTSLVNCDFTSKTAGYTYAAAPLSFIGCAGVNPIGAVTITPTTHAWKNAAGASVRAYVAAAGSYTGTTTITPSGGSAVTVPNAVVGMAYDIPPGATLTWGVGGSVTTDPTFDGFGN